MRLPRPLAVALLAAAALTVTACGEPVVGTVVGKEYDEAETKKTTRQDCTTKTVNGTSKTTCKTVPTTKYEPEEWELTVETDDGDTREVDVSEREFDRIRVGDRYDENLDGTP